MDQTAEFCCIASLANEQYMEFDGNEPSCLADRQSQPGYLNSLQAVGFSMVDELAGGELAV